MACCRPIDETLEPDLFKTLADPTRVSLLAGLAKCGRPCSVTEVAACCSVDLSVVSRHLALLERAGVLDSVKTGRTVLYTVRYRELSQKLRDLADAIDDCCPAPASPDTEHAATPSTPHETSPRPTPAAAQRTLARQLQRQRKERRS